MSLDFNYSKIADYEIVTTHPEDLGKDPKTELVRYHPVFGCLVWMMKSIGVSSITPENLKMVQDRVALYQKAFGPAIVTGAIRGGIYITDEDVARYVGLSTNVSDMSDSEFLMWLGRTMLREATFRAPSRLDPATSAYDLTAYLCIKLDDGSYYV